MSTALEATPFLSLDIAGGQRAQEQRKWDRESRDIWPMTSAMGTLDARKQGPRYIGRHYFQSRILYSGNLSIKCPCKMRAPADK